MWFGSRCCTRTKAIPGSVSGGIAEKKASNAASPPADAPIPTMGKFSFGALLKPAFGEEFLPMEVSSSIVCICPFSGSCLFFGVCTSSSPIVFFSTIFSYPSRLKLNNCNAFKMCILGAYRFSYAILRLG
ncbi:MAG TPA: hypothetical protein VN278_01860 [Methanosarcina sp.]|nr:hypothetical protein [Methanosarcina sp.]